ncbi:MAG: DUF2452 domain-containing protein [Bacteroidetes bacterium]|nr:MAG: DUF2452 domain-containing protein [Bacteroidota bacterium]
MEKNPIDRDKITETPHSLPYAHTVGGFEIRPIDKGRVKGNAIQAMEEQAQMQMNQIREQIELLVKQAQQIKKRVEISQDIYLADMNFEPVIGKIYHLFERKNGQKVLSMIGPEEWGPSMPFERFLASVKLLADHSWEVVEG